MDPAPEDEVDIETTRRLREVGEIMRIAVLDHIVFNRTEYFSSLEKAVGI